ncbi:MAG: hypothetical protein K2R98_08785 [Gemmataceae bacterium]|nr:hypothetical protein [Gemmataceae bacterium]
MRFFFAFLCSLGGLVGAYLGAPVFFTVGMALSFCCIFGGMLEWFLVTIICSVAGAFVAGSLARGLATTVLTQNERIAIPIIFGTAVGVAYFVCLCQYMTVTHIWP